MKEIPISKRNLLVGLILAVVLALGILAIQLFIHPDGQDSKTSPDDNLASNSAVTALEAFFHVDYQEGQDAWLNRICAASTTSGCQFISAGASQMWKKYSDDKTNVTAKVTPEMKLAETATEQVWKLSVSLSAALPGSNKTQDAAYVAVSKTDKGWKFDRFLLEPEVKVILARQAGIATPVGGQK